MAKSGRSNSRSKNKGCDHPRLVDVREMSHVCVSLAASFDGLQPLLAACHC